LRWVTQVRVAAGYHEPLDAINIKKQGATMSKNIFLLFIFILLTACTAVQVTPINKDLALKNVCIQKNNKVTVHDFLPVVRDGFERHGISNTVFQEQKPNNCDAVLTYTALRSWDVSTYLSHAELELYKNDIKIASATYHLNGKGGLDLTKWKSVKSKMDPVIDELLREYK
jgi:hypothetical protein